ncbi:hypothetical protein [Novosphingobium sp.]|uniref:hypothetical protein n=1 Tax=Novosphingobium sp. TaxID=1874826 RepID=UPI0035B49E4C
MAIGAALLFAAMATGGAAPAATADEVIARTRTTSATYSAYFWNVITFPDGETIAEWSAEFHKGRLHRVETPRDRIVANCADGTGTHFNLMTGELRRGPEVARSACGIDANGAVLSAEVTGQVPHRFAAPGMATALRLVGAETVRTYTVSPDGVLLTFGVDPLGAGPRLTGAIVALQDTVDDDLFSEESLEQSAVPPEYQAEPKPGA